MSRIDEFATDIRGPHERASYDGSADPAEMRAKRLDAIAKAAFNNLRAYSNCCRSTLWALQTHLRLDGPNVLNAATTLAGGIGGTGETCGAVIGALMAIGLGQGSSGLEDLASDRRAREASRRFVERFIERFGSTRCYEVQEATVGWRCDGPSRTTEWRKAEGPVACAAVCAEAARIAADLILGEVSLA
jgi:C_GCAxxG_C_C family probable redox protein